jgi:CheY-like chemotaxis protein
MSNNLFQQNDDLQRVNILLIDDAKPLLMILGTALRNCGHTVFAAESGMTGMQLYELNPIDVVVCDLAMDDMDGWEVSKAVMDSCKKRSVTKTPFIMLTGYTEEMELCTNLEDRGVDKVVNKPVDIKGLIKLVEELAGFEKDKSE